MKYFFLTDGWTVGRVWAFDGLWNETAWRRQPDIQRLNLCLVEESEKLWLYRVEDEVLTVEVIPITKTQGNAYGSSGTADKGVCATDPNRLDFLERAQVKPSVQAIGQVVLKRLISAEQVLERLGTAQTMCQLTSIQTVLQ
ncbi:MAG: hypothetical protein JO235_21485 [Chroococcidiopsidaceae cyanobacterium CP_BM_RX_35]|nr:hypothetical protein [Chroococcidiopsidaceae cyanobacterium CP_BM_RX_35]